MGIIPGYLGAGNSGGYRAFLDGENNEGAAALYIAVNRIIDGKNGSEGMLLKISCAGGAELILDRRPSANDGQDGQMETFLVINKNNTLIPFKFTTYQYQVKENGQMVTKIIETGLGVFEKTIEGYLNGIGADRHLSKLPEDFDELENERKQSSNATGNNNYQISYGNYQNTPSYGQT